MTAAVPVNSQAMYLVALELLRGLANTVRVAPLRTTLGLALQAQTLAPLGSGGTPLGALIDALHRVYRKDAPFDEGINGGYLELFGNVEDPESARNRWRNSVNAQKGIGCFGTIAELVNPAFRAAERPACQHRVHHDGDFRCDLSNPHHLSTCRSAIQHAGEAPKLLRQLPSAAQQYSYEWVPAAAADVEKLVDQPIPVWPLIVTLYAGSRHLHGGRGVISEEQLADDLGITGNLATILDLSPNNPANRRILRMTEPYLLACLWRKLWDDGFRIEFEDLINFYLALKPRGFVILSGISGNGKSQLVRRLAELIRLPNSPPFSNLESVPVPPNWNDMSHLFGFYNSLRLGFEPGPALAAIRKAIDCNDQHGSCAVFLQLDELNLSRVEHYLSDYLSVMETKRFMDGKWVIDPIRVAGGRLGTIPYVGAEGEAKDFVNQVPAEVMWPENLLLVGTINIDESTQGISPKVLDRANSIEVDLPPMTALAPAAPPGYEDAELHYLGHYLADRPYRTFEQALDARPNEVAIVFSWLNDVNDLLRRWRVQFGARVYHEVCIYVAYSADLIDQAEAIDVNLHGFTFVSALDRQVMQKILPRISGTQDQLKYGAEGDFFEIFGALLKETGLTRSASKLARMATQEIVSFWEA